MYTAMVKGPFREWDRADTPRGGDQWWANPNPDLYLNPDLTNFPNPIGFGFDLNFFKSVNLDLDLSFLESGGFGFRFEHCWIWI